VSVTRSPTIKFRTTLQRILSLPYCDVALDENEGFYEEPSQISQQAQVTMNTMAQRLSLERFSVNRYHGHITLSNHDTTADPDLRYIVYIPFLQRGCPGAMHEQSARAFTSAVLSRLTGDKTIIFEFREPPSYSTMAILQDCRAYLLSTTPDYIGAKVEVPACEGVFDTFSGRLHPNSPSEDSISNVPSFACTPCRTSAVLLDRPEFEAPGGVVFLLADPVNPGHTNYTDMLVLRSAGPDEVARRLEMKFQDHSG